MSGPFEDLQQGTDEWLIAKLGKVSASRLADVMARTKSGYGASRKNYMAELLVQRLTGEPTEHFVSKDMQWGIEHEDEARAAYEEYSGVFVRQVGFIAHPTIPMAGASPDGLVGEDGLVEIKCPNTATHVDTLTVGAPDTRYFKQMQCQMECTGRGWCDFVSYDPRMPHGLDLFVVRVNRDEAFLAEAREEVKRFLAELDEMEAKLRVIAEKRLHEK